MYYKFLESQHVDRVMVDRTILVKNSTYIRKLAETSPIWISDRLEAASEVVFNKEITFTEYSDELKKINAPMPGFLDVKDNAAIKIMPNVAFKFVIDDVYIYSASIGHFPTLKQAMCVDAPVPYNACLRIRGMQLLTRAVMETGWIQELKCPVKEIFHLGDCKRVEYCSLSNDFEEILNSASPFKKSLLFQTQSEIRFTLIPLKSLSTNQLTIEIKSPEKLFDIIVMSPNTKKAL